MFSVFYSTAWLSRNTSKVLTKRNSLMVVRYFSRCSVVANDDKASNRRITFWQLFNTAKYETKANHLRDVIYQLKCGLEEKKDIYKRRMKGNSKQVTHFATKKGEKIPPEKFDTEYENPVKLGPEEMKLVLNNYKKDLFVLVAVDKVEYIENYEHPEEIEMKKLQLEKERILEEKRQSEREKLGQMQELFTKLSQDSMSSSLVLDVAKFSILTDSLNTATLTQCLESLQKVKTLEVGGKFPDISPTKLKIFIPKLGNGNLFKDVHADRTFQTAVDIIKTDASKMNTLSIIKCFHSLTFLYKDSFQVELENHILNTNVFLMLEEIGLLSEVLTFSNRKQAFNVHSLFNYFKLFVLKEQTLTSDDYEILLKLCIFFTSEFNDSEQCFIVRQQLRETCVRMVPIESLNIALQFLSWNLLLETDSWKYDFEIKWIDPLIRSSIDNILSQTENLLPCHFEYFTQHFYEFYDELQHCLTSRAFELLENDPMCLQEQIWCLGVCSSRELSVEKADEISHRVETCCSELFIEFLQNIGQCKKESKLQQATFLRISELAPLLMQNSQNMEIPFKFLEANFSSDELNSGNEEFMRVVKEMFERIEEVASDVSEKVENDSKLERQKMENLSVRRKEIVVKMLLWASTFINLQKNSIATIEIILPGVLATLTESERTRMVRQLSKIMLRNPEMVETQFVLSLVKVVDSNSRSTDNKSSSGQERKFPVISPELMEATLGRDRLAVELLLEIFNNPLVNRVLNIVEISKTHQFHEAQLKVLVRNLVLLLAQENESVDPLEILGSLDLIPAAVEIRSQDDLNNIFYLLLANSAVESFKKCCKHLEQRSKDKWFDSDLFTRQYVWTLHQLHRCNLAGRNMGKLMKQIFSEDHLSAVYQVTSVSAHLPALETELFHVNRDACVLYPQLSIPWFQTEALTWQISELESNKSKGYPADINTALAHLVPGPDHIRRDVELDYGICVDNCLLLDRDSGFVKVTDEALRYAAEMDLNKVAVVYRPEDHLDYVYNRDIPVAPSTYLYLHKLGFSVVVVHSYEWNSVCHASLEDKVTMLRQKIYNVEEDEGEIIVPYREITHSRLSTQWEEYISVRGDEERDVHREPVWSGSL